jgi:hypothetical protein
MSYEFEDVHVDALDDDHVFVCAGEVEYSIDWGEPDEPWGYWGATPGTAPQVEVEGWDISDITDYDGNDQSLRFNEHKAWMEQLQDEILKQIHDDIIEGEVKAAQENAAEAAYENQKEREAGL